MDFGLTDYLALAGAALLLALCGWIADRRRMRRRDPDAVGWVPWRAVSFWATMVGVLALAGAAAVWRAS